MGWTYTANRFYSEADLTEFFQENLIGSTILASAVVDNVFYAAVSSPKKPAKVWAYIALLDFLEEDEDEDGMRFGFKEMDETSGPAARTCPAKILDLLTPTDHQWALEWRFACRQNLAGELTSPC